VIEHQDALHDVTLTFVNAGIVKMTADFALGEACTLSAVFVVAANAGATKRVSASSADFARNIATSR
jgi:hypothetical protein